LVSVGVRHTSRFATTSGSFPLAALAAVLLFVDGRARTVFVLLGRMFLLQTPKGLDTAKLAFLAEALVAFIGALLRVQALRRTHAYRLAQPLLVASWRSPRSPLSPSRSRISTRFRRGIGSATSTIRLLVAVGTLGAFPSPSPGCGAVAD
jgi:hypothetical protein